MSDLLNFKGRVAIITGAGGGLGRAYALLLSNCGCHVIVNDLGGTKFGDGSSHMAADKVVQEIQAMNGSAKADYHSVVTEGHKIVEIALKAFGRIDIVINNAGILRDKLFEKMTDEDFTMVTDVHLLGAHMVTQAAWPHMLQQKYGRVLFTSSAAGLYGNPGQVNYAAAKAGLIGMGKSLAIEGAAKNINVNIIAPFAASRITEPFLTTEMIDILTPDVVAPFVGWLCHEKCKETGGVFEVAGGVIARVANVRTSGLLLNADDPMKLSPEIILRQFSKIQDFSPSNVTYPQSITEVDWVGLVEKGKQRVNNQQQNYENASIITNISFTNGEVAIVTGAGNGLGRSYAFALAKRGCKVVVNDLAGPSNTDGRRPAEIVVDKIRENGGIAIANYDNVATQAEKIIDTGIQAFGRVDILIHNAGVLRDRSYSKMSLAEWQTVSSVHLLAAFRLTKAIYPYLLKQGYGRIIYTTSAVGLYGNFGQVNYSTAKAALIGLAKSLVQEIELKEKKKKSAELASNPTAISHANQMDIKINVIAPNAGTAMTATILPEDIVNLLKPDYVAPLVTLLSSKNCPTQSNIFEVGSGWAACVQSVRSIGFSVFSKPFAQKLLSASSIEQVERSWLSHADRMTFSVNHPSLVIRSAAESLKKILEQCSINSANHRSDSSSSTVKSPAGTSPPVSPPGASSAALIKDHSLIKPSESVQFQYSDKDILLYHLGIHCTTNQQLYELDPKFNVIPSFWCLSGMSAILPNHLFSLFFQPSKNYQVDAHSAPKESSLSSGGKEDFLPGLSWMKGIVDPDNFQPAGILHANQELNILEQFYLLPAALSGNFYSKVLIKQAIYKASFGGPLLVIQVNTYPNKEGNRSAIFIHKSTIILRGSKLLREIAGANHLDSNDTSIAAFLKSNPNELILNLKSNLWQAPAEPSTNLATAGNHEKHSIVVSYEEVVPENLPAIYRLSGDRNPLHMDPQIASFVGFQKGPILHGMCTYGMACKHLLQFIASLPSKVPSRLIGSDTNLGSSSGIPALRHFSARFSSPVYPGDTLRFIFGLVPVTTNETSPIKNKERIDMADLNHDSFVIHFQVKNISQENKICLDQGIAICSYSNYSDKLSSTQETQNRASAASPSKTYKPSSAVSNINKIQAPPNSLTLAQIGNQLESQWKALPDAKRSDLVKSIPVIVSFSCSSDASSLICMDFKSDPLGKIYVLSSKQAIESMKADVSFQFSSLDILITILKGKLSPQVAFLQKKLSIIGNQMLAFKMDPVFKAFLPFAMHSTKSDPQQTGTLSNASL